MPRDPQKGTQSASKDKESKTKEEPADDNLAKNSKPSDRLVLIDAEFNRKKGRRKAPTSLLVFELDEKIQDFLLGKDTEIISKSLFEIVKDGKKPIAISSSQEILDRVSKDLFEMDPILLKEDSLKKLKEEAMTAFLGFSNEKIMPESSIFIGYLFSQSEMTNDVMFKFGTVVTPDQYFSTVGTIPREKDELRGVLSKHPKNAEESLADALAQVKPSLNDSTHSARLNHSSETANGVEVPNGEPVKRRRGRAPKKPTPYDEEFEEEDRKPKALDKPKKATASVSSKVASPEKKEGRGRGRRGGKAGNKAGEKHRDKNQINSEKMSSTANHVDEEVDFSQPEKAAASLRHLNKRIGGGLHGNIEKIKNDPTESCVNDSSSTASGVHSKRKLSFEDEIFDHMDDAIEKILERRALSVTPLGGSSREITQKIKSIRLEPRDTDAPPICKKLKQTEKKFLPQPNAPVEEQVMIDSDQVLLNYEVKFPFEKTSKGFQIYARDIEMLDPDQYINDTILQFYLKLIHKEFLNEESQKKVYFFNTYLIDKLKSEAQIEPNFEKAYNSVKRWTKDDIFEKDFLVFPNYDGNAKHWSLYIICHPNHFIPTGPDDEIHPRLLYFDSLGTMDYATPLLITSFLKYELKNKKPELFAQKEKEFRDIDFKHLVQLIVHRVPLQDNYSDCGLYVCEFAERFLLSPNEFLSRIENNRDFLDKFPLQPLKNKRNDIKKIIFGLSRGNKNVLDEYLAERKRRFEYAAAHPDTEYVKLDEASLVEFCSSYSEDYKALDPRGRDLMKLRYYLWKQEKKLTEIAQ